MSSFGLRIAGVVTAWLGRSGLAEALLPWRVPGPLKCTLTNENPLFCRAPINYICMQPTKKWVLVGKGSSFLGFAMNILNQKPIVDPTLGTTCWMQGFKSQSCDDFDMRTQGILNATQLSSRLSTMAWTVL